MAPSKKNSSKRVIDFEGVLSSSDEEILEIDPKSKQPTRTSSAQRLENDGLSLTDCSETEQVEPKKAAKKRKVDPHTAVLNSVTLADVVLAKNTSEWVSVNPRNKEEKTALISIKGIGIKQIQQLTLRDIAKPRFSKCFCNFINCLTCGIDISKSVRSSSKYAICELIVQRKRSMERHAAMYANPEESCDANGIPSDYYRLINVLVSDAVRHMYAELGMQTSRAARDADHSPQTVLKTTIFQEYHKDNLYNELLYQHYRIDASTIDPSNYTAKTTAQLDSMRKSLERDYQFIVSKTETVSGSNKPFDECVNGDTKQIYKSLSRKFR